MEIRVDFERIPEVVKKYSDSKLPIHLQLDITELDQLKKEHFSELAKLPLTFFRFTVWKKEKFYCEGLDQLQTLDSLELGGFSHPFLNDASKLKELEFLQLEIFRQDSTIREKSSFQKLKKLRITLSQVYDLSQMFDSLPELEFLDLTKVDAKFRLSSSMILLGNCPIEKICFGIVTIDTTQFKSAVFPNLKKIWLVGVSYGIRSFDFEQFFRQNPSLEYADVTMNNLSKEYVADLRTKFPNIKIDRDW